MSWPEIPDEMFAEPSQTDAKGFESATQNGTTTVPEDTPASIVGHFASLLPPVKHEIDTLLAQFGELALAMNAAVDLANAAAELAALINEPPPGAFIPFKLACERAEKVSELVQRFDQVLHAAKLEKR